MSPGWNNTSQPMLIQVTWVVHLTGAWYIPILWLDLGEVYVVQQGWDSLHFHIFPFGKVPVPWSKYLHSDLCRWYVARYHVHICLYTVYWDCEFFKHIFCMLKWYVWSSILTWNRSRPVPSLPAVSLHQPHHHTCRAERCLREFQTASPRFVTKTTKGGEVFNKTICQISIWWAHFSHANCPNHLQMFSFRWFTTKRLCVVIRRSTTH